jgi:bla regulator protein blaR1
MSVLAIVAFPSPAWTTLGAPLANDLWQSTLFAGIAGLLTLAFKENRADVRYWLWFSASVKFLFPFSLLVALGSRMGASTRPANGQHGLSFVVQQIGQPFATASRGHFAAPVAAGASEVAVRILPDLLLIVWCVGSAAVLFSWWRRWRRVSAAMRTGSCISARREFEILQALRALCGISGRVELVTCQSAVEPGIIGMLHPVVALPAGIAGQLSDAQLASIMIHELCHFRRRDNLTAAIHMCVEAIFWFHPLLWWLGTRLVDERERACDEEVLRLGSDPQTYAEGILKVCEFYLESPLFCAAGVTGSNLKKRMEAIMTHRIASKLNFAGKSLLTVTAAAALLGPVGIGLLNPVASRAQSESTPAVTPALAVVEIKPSTAMGNTINVRRLDHTDSPSELQAIGITLPLLVALAYDVNNFQVSGGPEWATSAKYDVEVRTAGDQQLLPAVQAALAGQFKLAIHHETKDRPAYELVVGDGGSKLKEVPSGDVSPAKSRIWLVPLGHLEAKQVSMSLLAKALSSQTGRPVIDKTGLTGVYDFTLDWDVAPISFDQASKMEFVPSPATIASLVAAVPQQLGLQLNEQSAPLDTIVIDYAAPLAGNQ